MKTLTTGRRYRRNASRCMACRAAPSRRTGGGSLRSVPGLKGAHQGGVGVVAVSSFSRLFSPTKVSASRASVTLSRSRHLTRFSRSRSSYQTSQLVYATTYNTSSTSLLFFYSFLFEQSPTKAKGKQFTTKARI